MTFIPSPNCRQCSPCVLLERLKLCVLKGNVILYYFLIHSTNIQCARHLTPRGENAI